MLDTKPVEMKIPAREKTEADYAMPMFKDPPKPVQTVLEDTSKSKFTQDIKPAEVISKDQSARRENILAVKQSEEYHHETRIDDIPRDFAGKSDKTAEQRMAEAVEKAEASWGVRPMTEQSVSEQPQAPAEAVPEPENIPEPAADVPETAQSSENEKTDISEHLQSGYGTESEGVLDSLTSEEPKKDFKYINARAFENKPQPEEKEEKPEPKETYFRIIGEAFKNYAIAETEDGILIVDKHAAHERIRFERLRTGREDLTAQMLLVPEELLLDYGEYDALVKNLRVCADCGFEIEPLEAPKVLIKGIPSMLDKNDASDIVSELAQNFAVHRHDPLPEILDDMYHTMACRGAIKANDITGLDELKSLIGQILEDERIRYCPHGRPVMFKLTKRELEKQFKRIV